MPGVPPALDEVTEIALAREPRARFVNADAMALALEEACPPASRQDVAAFVERIAAAELRDLSRAIRRAEDAARDRAVKSPAPGRRRGGARVAGILSLVGLAASTALFALGRAPAAAPASSADAGAAPARWLGGNW